MAEFCLDCWNKINETDDDEREYILSEDLDLCEGCGEWKHVIVAKRKSYYDYKFRWFILPIKFIYKIVYCLWRLVILPFMIFKYIKWRKDGGKL